MIKIIYIAGDGRSGSTLLDGILSNIKDSISIGEAHRFWVRFNEGFSNCGCGNELVSCELWSAVDRKIISSFPSVDRSYFLNKVKEIQYYRNFKEIPNLMNDEEWKPFFEMVKLFYLSISEISSNDILIDSSKSIGWARMLQYLDYFDVKIIHLERRLPEVVNSWKKKVRLPEYSKQEVWMPQKSTPLAIKSWLKVKVMAKRLKVKGNYIFVSFEKLQKNQDSELHRILSFVNESIPLKELTFQKTHAIGGNPSRGLNTENIVINESRQELKRINGVEKFITVSVDFFAKMLLS